MRRLTVLAVLAALVASAFAATAQAGGEFTSITARFGQSPIVHYRIRYDLWAPNWMDCYPDEYDYTDPECWDYEDGGDATIDVRVFNVNGKRRKLVHHEVEYGFNGKADLDLYAWQINAPYYGRKTLAYRVVFRLIDPSADRVTGQIINRRFEVYYS